MAWLLAAIAGIPVALVSAWGLAGGYSFRYLPYLLVPYAVPLVVAPLIAGFLSSEWPNSAASSWAAVAIAVLCVGASGLAVLALGFTLPLSMLDDSGHASDNLASLAGALLVALTFVIAAIVWMVGLVARAFTRGPQRTIPDQAKVLRKSALVAGGVGVLLVVSGIAGLANGSRLDGAGIPIQPGDSWMASRPESTMAYPGAQVTNPYAAAEEKQLSHSPAAQAGITFYTGDPAATVQAWYAQRLLARGWTTTGLTRAGEDGLWAFNRGDRELFELAFYKPSAGLPGQAQHPGEGRFRTTYLVFPIGEPHF